MEMVFARLFSSPVRLSSLFILNDRMGYSFVSPIHFRSDENSWSSSNLSITRLAFFSCTVSPTLSHRFYNIAENIISIVITKTTAHVWWYYCECAHTLACTRSRGWWVLSSTQFNILSRYIHNLPPTFMLLLLLSLLLFVALDCAGTKSNAVERRTKKKHTHTHILEVYKVGTYSDPKQKKKQK